jgi:hypothetical protein
MQKTMTDPGGSSLALAEVDRLVDEYRTELIKEAGRLEAEVNSGNPPEITATMVQDAALFLRRGYRRTKRPKGEKIAQGTATLAAVGISARCYHHFAVVILWMGLLDMPEEHLNAELTPAARAALDELAALYSTRVFLSAQGHASGLTSRAREVSVRDIYEGARQLAEREVGERRSSRLKTGLLITATGALALLFMLAVLTPEEALPGPLLLISAGALAGVTFVTTLRHFLRGSRETDVFERRMLSDRAVADKVVFLTRWEDLELLIRTVTATVTGESTASSPLSLLIFALSSRNIINSADATTLKELLTLRNNIVHEGEPVSATFLRSATRRAEHIYLALAHKMREADGARAPMGAFGRTPAGR